ncbi:unnamed protein product [Rodentolepis nana]|uniref:DNA-directed RNA polymerase n=1 Tax=Rodentolepis nana TaxID=102285 RepID=A0A0R3TJ90_RODNA|nr:unnamed protein product [Rodentolepis nana]
MQQLWQRMKFVRQGYLSGGAGYVVSRAALKMIAEGMEKEVSSCRKRGGAEDVNLARRLSTIPSEYVLVFTFVCQG